jgi:hypothetical protein
VGGRISPPTPENVAMRPPSDPLACGRRGPPFAAWVTAAVVIVEMRLADGRTATIRSAASGVW